MAAITLTQRALSVAQHWVPLVPLWLCYEGRFLSSSEGLLAVFELARSWCAVCLTNKGLLSANEEGLPDQGPWELNTQSCSASTGAPVLIEPAGNRKGPSRWELSVSTERGARSVVMSHVSNSPQSDLEKQKGMCRASERSIGVTPKRASSFRGRVRRRGF